MEDSMNIEDIELNQALIGKVVVKLELSAGYEGESINKC